MLEERVNEILNRSDGKQVKLFLNNYSILNEKNDLIKYIKERGFNNVIHIGFAGHPRSFEGCVKKGI